MDCLPSHANPHPCRVFGGSIVDGEMVSRVRVGAGVLRRTGKVAMHADRPIPGEKLGEDLGDGGGIVATAERRGIRGPHGRETGQVLPFHFARPSAPVKMPSTSAAKFAATRASGIDHRRGTTIPAVGLVWYFFGRAAGAVGGGVFVHKLIWVKRLGAACDGSAPGSPSSPQQRAAGRRKAQSTTEEYYTFGMDIVISPS